MRGGVLSLRNKLGCVGKFVLLGVAANWGKRKGLDVFLSLSERLDERYQIILVGTDEIVDNLLPSNIISIHRTQDQMELASIYMTADLFVNPTREEVMGMVNVESLACGTPVITFSTGGSPECVDNSCGSIVSTDDNKLLLDEIIRICEQYPFKIDNCLKRARFFEMKKRYEEYLRLYEDCTHSSDFSL